MPLRGHGCLQTALCLGQRESGCRITQPGVGLFHQKTILLYTADPDGGERDEGGADERHGGQVEGVQGAVHPHVRHQQVHQARTTQQRQALPQERRLATGTIFDDARDISQQATMAKKQFPGCVNLLLGT